MLTADDDFLAYLGLDSSAGLADIRRAYALRLRRIDQAGDPAAFQHLREAYEAAMAWVACKHEGDGDLVAPAASMPPLPETPRPEARQAAAASAQEALSRFRAACQILVDSDQRLHEEEWRRLLHEALAHPDLISFEARELFEAHLAAQLAAGWQPGHERLFNAAGEVFGWFEEPDGLMHHAAAGEVLWSAYLEELNFTYQSPMERGAQERVIERLRRSAPPDSAQLKRSMLAFEKMLARFPHWTALTLDPAKIAQWRSLYCAQNGGPFPVQDHDLYVARAPHTRHDNSLPTRIGQGAWILAWFIFMLFRFREMLF